MNYPAANKPRARSERCEEVCLRLTMPAARHWVSMLCRYFKKVKEGKGKPMLKSGDVTQLLQQHGQGDDAAFNRLFGIVYNDLRRTAANLMKKERPNHTLQATGLVNEAYLRLSRQHAGWENRGHFFAIAARVMRRILVDGARSRCAEKRGDGMKHQEFDENTPNYLQSDPGILALDDALIDLAKEHARPAQITELKFFVGLEIDEIAALLELSPATVERDAALAKAWLYRYMTQEKPKE